MIIDGGRVAEIKDYMEANKEQYGMQSFDQALTDLVISKQISFHAALAAASKPADFELKLRMFGGAAAEGMHEHDTPMDNEAITPGAGAGLEFMQQ
jgi:Tfp pilus assembly ATPase PilU